MFKKNKALAEAAPQRAGLIAILKAELAAERDALAELQNRIAALRESIAKTHPAQTLEGEQNRRAVEARSELPILYYELRERAENISTAQARMAEAQQRAGQARALRDKLASELAPCEEAARRLEKCAEELSDLRYQFTTMRDVTVHLLNIAPVALELVKNIEGKRALLERARADLAELLGG